MFEIDVKKNLNQSKKIRKYSQNYTKDCKRVRVRMGSDSEWSSGRGYGAKKKTKKKNKTKQKNAMIYRKQRPKTCLIKTADVTELIQA